MKPTKLFLSLLMSVLLITLFACQNKTAEKEVEAETESEESGTKLTLNEKYDSVRNGARLILTYDKQSNSFLGTVENTTDKTLKKVRVEVHLSNGTELGPTTPTDLEPGKKVDVKLEATTEAFDAWTAHPEVGEIEHGHGEGGEHDGEHEKSEEHEKEEKH